MYTYNVSVYLITHCTGRVCNKYIRKGALTPMGKITMRKCIEWDFLNLALLTQGNIPWEVQITFSHASKGKPSGWGSHPLPLTNGKPWLTVFMRSNHQHGVLWWGGSHQVPVHYQHTQVGRHQQSAEATVDTRMYALPVRNHPVIYPWDGPVVRNGVLPHFILILCRDSKETWIGRWFIKHILGHR